MVEDDGVCPDGFGYGQCLGLADLVKRKTVDGMHGDVA